MDSGYLAKATVDPEYNTPEKYINMARRVLGPFNTDPASNAEAQKTVQAKYFYTKENSGLGRTWYGPVWLNPPYDNTGPWVERLIDEHLENPAKTAILLTHDCTDTTWFHNALANCGAVCMPVGRIPYLKDSSSGPMRGSTFFYFGPQVDKFADVFSDIGSVVRVFRRMKEIDTQGPGPEPKD